jgi:hypothetical protein
MWAVLVDAIDVLERARCHPTTRHLREAREVAEWVCDEDVTWPVSFRNVCDVLGLDPTRARKCLKSRGLLQ